MSGRVFVSLLESLRPPSRTVVERHVVYLRDLDARGALIVCGPFRDGEGGMICFLADSEDEARAIAQGDPFVELGFKRLRLREIERATRENDYLLGS
jgi:uncharacterized protein